MEIPFYTIFAKRVIFKLFEEKIIFEIKEQYKLVGLIAAQKEIIITQLFLILLIEINGMDVS